MQKNYVLYYKDAGYFNASIGGALCAKTSTLVNLINKNNYTFITHHKLMELNPNPTDLFLLLFQNGKRARLS
jgi:hypothetical protein